VALQLYSLREDCRKDFFGTLEKVAGMGYEGVEFAGFYGKSAGEVRDKLRELGLGVAGSHTSFDSLVLWAFDKTVEFNEVLGNKNVIIPSLPGELRGGKKEWLSFANYLNELSRKLQPHGMRVGYHNHWDEFIPVEGERPWDIIGSNTVADVVLQLDVGHAARALGSPEEAIAQLDKYPKRSLTVHVKDFSKQKGYNVIPGEGDLNWEGFLSACKRNGTEWLIIEQEEYPYPPPVETAKRALNNLREFLKSI